MKDFLDQIITSSEDSTKISARVTGVLITGSSSVLPLLTSFLHLSITNEQLVQVVSSVGVVVGAVWFLFGVGRYVINKIGEKFIWGKKDN